jgi:lipopolysaccharide transport system permease protein
MEDTQEIVIKANQTGRISLKELWAYRELFFFFSWRDIKVRYKQTFIGAGWAILQPVLATGVFTLFFNKVAGISSGDASVPYPVFAFLGLMYWNAFSSTLNNVANSLLSNTGVLTKIYFPRLLPPLSATALSVVDFFFASIFFIIIILVYGTSVHLLGFLLFIPALILIEYGGLAVGIFFASLNVRYRDVRTALPFLMQLMLFVTPVIYPISRIPEKFRIFININPAAGAIDMIRAGLFGTPINWIGVLMSFIGASIAMYLALIYFKRTEKGFVDII